MEDFDIYEFDIDDLCSCMDKNVKEDIKNFEDLVDLQANLDRQVFLGDITYGIGSAIDHIIRFWNQYDEMHEIPVERRLPIKIYIDSNGGSLTDALTIIDAIKLSKTPVWTIAIGCVYSGAFFSFICGDKRIAYPHASFLFHEGSTGSSGTAAQFRNYADFYGIQLKQLKEIVLKHTDITEEEYNKVKKDDVWYDVQSGIEKGFIDEVAEGLV